MFDPNSALIPAPFRLFAAVFPSTVMFPHPLKIPIPLLVLPLALLWMMVPSKTVSNMMPLLAFPVPSFCSHVIWVEPLMLIPSPSEEPDTWFSLRVMASDAVSQMPLYRVFEMELFLMVLPLVETMTIPVSSSVIVFPEISLFVTFWTEIPVLVS